jgi:hypothetical protein
VGVRSGSRITRLVLPLLAQRRSLHCRSSTTTSSSTNTSNSSAAASARRAF